MSIIIYGLQNCDSTREARKFLLNQKLSFNFIDYRIEPLSRSVVSTWINQAGADKILNKKSKTWRELPAGQQSMAADEKSLIDLLLLHPTLIKRPVLEINGTILCGFKQDEYLSLLKNS